MCRLAAYLGPSIELERIVTRPCHSLLAQSQHATESKLEVNGDGFGLAWYGTDEQPGLYREILPAWSDSNLQDLCRLMKSHLFMAHLRASTIGETSRINCHPFRFGKHSFMHNGQIGGFQGLERTLETALGDDLYHARAGTTDSEMLFLTAMQLGAEMDPVQGILNAIERIQTLHTPGNAPIRIACVMSDGKKLYAVRHSSDQRSPTLYAATGLRSGGAAFASEPLDGDHSRWIAIGESQIAILDHNGLSVTDMPTWAVAA